jgi:hypothetical protein
LRPVQRLKSIAYLGRLAAIVGLAAAPAPGSPATGHRGCTFINNDRSFQGTVVIYKRRHVSCAQAKDVVRDYIEQVHTHFKRPHLIDGFLVRPIRHGNLVATRPADHARFVWFSYGTL